MPIKDKSLYPANWQEISLEARNRAGNLCQFCGVRNHAMGYRLVDGRFVPVESATDSAALRAGGVKVITIVLTVAHLDHDPGNNAPSNLRALCQKCHLGYDARLHAQHAAETRRRARLAQQPLLIGEQP